MMSFASVNGTLSSSSSLRTSTGTGESVTARGLPRTPVTITRSWRASSSPSPSCAVATGANMAPIDNAMTEVIISLLKRWPIDTSPYTSSASFPTEVIRTDPIPHSQRRPCLYIPMPDKQPNLELVLRSCGGRVSALERPCDLFGLIAAQQGPASP